MYQIFLAFHSVYVHNDGLGENGVGKNQNKISGGGERVEITQPLVCR